MAGRAGSGVAQSTGGRELGHRGVRAEMFDEELALDWLEIKYRYRSHLTHK